MFDKCYNEWDFFFSVWKPSKALNKSHILSVGRIQLWLKWEESFSRENMKTAPRKVFPATLQGLLRIKTKSWDKERVHFPFYGEKNLLGFDFSFAQFGLFLFSLDIK